jgi:hypothetical protein
MAADDQRGSERYHCEAPVVIEDCETGKVYDGSVYNYSRGGMYLEVDVYFKPGVEIQIDTEKSRTPSFPESCRARVVWCEEISGAVVLYNYGVGVQHDLIIRSSQTADKFQVIPGGLIRDDSY